MIGGRRPITGRKPGDRRVRVERPHAPYFRYTGPNQLVAKPAANVPRSALGRNVQRWKAWLLGRPLASEEEIGERLSKRLALPIFSSDAISSSAYATEEILRVLVLAGAAAMLVSIQVAIAISVLLAVVAISYRQVCNAFPGGGGAYAVARQELRPILGLVAAAALLIDYVMTVAVSTSSAMDQIISIVPGMEIIRLEVAVGVIALITIANLRGLRESGNIFAVPTYLFVAMALFIVGSGFIHIATGSVTPLAPQPQAVQAGTELLGMVLILRAFASGSVALTGVEAIANGVPAFKPPESKNAGNTMLAMAVLLGVIFIGVTVIARAYDIVPSEPLSGGPTVIALVAQTAFGFGSPLFYLFQVATALILFLAANTSFNAFPRLAAILAEDGYFPRQFSFRGDRLAYSWGIVLLAAIAAGLYVAFRGNTTGLIPLYSVGVFVCFTLSQSGMVLHWLRGRQAGWWWRLGVNAFGALLTFVVLMIVLVEKFEHGAWIVAILIPAIVGGMLFVNRQYAASARQLAVRVDYVVAPPNRQERAIVPVPSINRAVVRAINVARSITDDVLAVYISEDAEQSAKMRARWERQVPGVPLVIVESPYRALAGPLVAYLDVLDRAWPPDKPDPITFVVVPEYVARHWWERILYNQSARRLRTILLGRPHTVVVGVPYRRDDDAEDGREAVDSEEDAA
ncbi:MAG TPA: APC family permease [Candidatus Limnocylindrales bacterium]|nr:APC family permease [Candidatus Limnocylindrales bacterium]